MRVVFAAHPHGCISHTGDIPHWKGSAKGTAQHGAGMQCHRIPVRVSLVNADLVLLARPHSIPLLCHFHRSTADSQRRFQAARKRPCLQHDGACVSADVEAASAFYYTVRAADRSGLSILFEAIAPHPAAAPDRLGSQSACLWCFTADLRTRLIVMHPITKKCAVPLLRNVVWRIFRVITPNPVSLAHPTATSYGFCISRISYGPVRRMTTVSEFSRF